MCVHLPPLPVERSSTNRQDEPRKRGGPTGFLAAAGVKLLFLAVAWAVGGCGRQAPSAPPAPAGDIPPSTAASGSEVVVIGTQHFISDMPEGYTPAHLRVLLAKIKPDMVAVETPANFDDPWSLMPDDLRKVTKPWADEHQIPLVPVGSLDPTYESELAAMFKDYQEQGKGEAYEEIEQTLQAASARQPPTCAFVNSAAHQDLWRSYNQKLHDLYGRETPWETWNDKIVANIEKLCLDQPGKRVAVVFGGEHIYYLADRLRKNERITVVDVAKFFPLSEQEITAHTTKMDYLQSLRPLNFPALAPQHLPRLAAALAQIEDVAEFNLDYRLFHAKLLLHEGRFAEAQDEFSRVAEASGDRISAFDGQSRLREPALGYAAIAKTKQGHLAEARQDFDALLEAPETTVATRRWIEQLKAELTFVENRAAEQRPQAP